MPYSRVTRTAFGTEALNYVLNERPHNEAIRRNEIITPINLNPKKPYHVQFQKIWFKARINHKTQIIRIIQSFSKKEFDPNNPADIQKANELGQEFVDTYYPDRQALVCTQIDGKGGFVHNHILISDVSLKDNKGCTNEQYHYKTIRKWSDEIVSHYTVLDYGEKSNDGKTHYEKKLEEQGLFSYKEEIRKRVTEVMKNSVSEEDFLKKLTENGVDTIKKPSKKYGDYYVYELVDVSEIPEGTKIPNHALNARSYKLGNTYGPDALRKCIEANMLAVATAEPIKESLEPDIFYESEISPKISFSAKEKTEQKEAFATPPPIPKTEYLPDNTYADIQVALVNFDEDEEENEVISGSEIMVNVSEITEETTAVPTEKIKMEINKKSSENDTEHYSKRSAQLAQFIYDTPTTSTDETDLTISK
ncbi:MAG: hypothetical protein E7509_07985 [Ruminococcus sp.]|nr:hypothetical protein [Ruminococcus sp.]